MTKLKFLMFSSALALAAAASSADASVLIQGTGLWGAGTPTTPYSRRNRSFQFSFVVPDSFASNGTSATTSSISNFTYTLNDVAVAGIPTSVRFYSIAQRGLFDLFFPSYTISLYGVDIGSDGTVGPTSVNPFTAAINGTETGAGSVTVTVDSVPEPATWAMMILGMGAVGYAMRRRSAVRTTVRYA